MDNQYYYKLMASYLSKRNCDESFMRYFFGKNSSKKTPEELERAEDRKRRLQRERSRRYRALKNARRNHEGGREAGDEPRGKARAPPDDEPSDPDEPPTLCDLSYEPAPGRGRERASSRADPDDADADAARALSLTDFLRAPHAELDYPTVHSLMFHWLQT